MSNIYILEYIGTFRPTDGFVQFRPEYWRKRITNEIMLSSVIFKIICLPPRNYAIGRNIQGQHQVLMTFRGAY